MHCGDMVQLAELACYKVMNACVAGSGVRLVVSICQQHWIGLHDMCGLR